LQRGIRATTICFQCYRADLERQRAIRAAGNLNTASEARFQSTLPFEPVNRPRLETLRVERLAARAAPWPDAQRHDIRRRRAQIAARHALAQIGACLQAGGLSNRDDAMAAALHAAELQLPDSWLPFVVSR
jgi:hypothetical protein